MNQAYYYKIVCLIYIVFFGTNLYSNNPQLENLEQERNNALEVFSKLDDENSYNDQLHVSDLNNLPIGISRTINNVEYTIAISSFRHKGEFAELTIYGRVKIPQAIDEGKKDKILLFGAQGIKLSYDGDIVGDAKLLLLGNISIPINGGSATLVLKGKLNKAFDNTLDATYISIDCKGFKEMGISADVIFSDKLIRAVDINGEPDGEVKGSFKTIVSNWNDILVSLTLPSFEILGLKGFVFNIKEAVFDFSESRNDNNMSFPSGYNNKYLIPGNHNLWKGVYIRHLSITLPKQFMRRDSKERISFVAQNMILDNNGISGLFAVENVLSFEKGSAGGWRFSVNQFSLNIEANQLIGAKFSGNIGIPVSKASSFCYEASITPDNEYYLKVNPEKSINFDIWAAKAEILPNSYIQLKVKDDRFYPETMLNGSLSIAATNSADTTSKTIAQLNDIKFKGLLLKTEAPFISIESLGYSGEVKLMGFPLSLNNIKLIANDSEAKLSFETKLALAGDKCPIMAKTRIEVIGGLNEKDGLQRWDYKKINISDIAVDATMAGCFSIKGGLKILNDDPTYGDGFAGNIELVIKKGMSLKTNVRAIFGKKDFRYWFVDGKVAFTPGVLVFPPVKLSGFGGGAYYRMRPDGEGSGTPTNSKYVPDKNWGLGLKAAVLFNIGTANIANGEALFEIAFNNNGGLNFIGFYGQTKVLSKIAGDNDVEKFVSKKFKKIAEKEANFVKKNSELMRKLERMKIYEPSKASQYSFEGSEKVGESGFSAALGIQYDFTRNSLHSTFDLYVNMLGGMLKGTASGNRAGWAVLHVDPNEWYMHMGTPDDRLGIKFNLANLVSMETGAYFMMGDKIPGSPPPPKQVSDILKVDAEKLNYMRDLNALGDGRGLAFGSDFRVSKGDITFLIIYANFQAGLGFDIMLKDYQDAQCKGRSGPIGMNGWFANGQAYAYLQGELGVRIRLLFIRKKIPIIRGAAAALMQAKLPNPSWFAGYLGVRFDLLGGLIRGSIRLKISLGEECEIVLPGGSPLGVKVISDLTPSDKADKIDVFTVPQAAFNMPIGKVFEMEDDKGIKKYKLNLEEFSVSDNGNILPGKIKWNSGRDAASFYSHEILPPNTSLQAVVRVTFEEYQNGRWVTVHTGGKKAEERMEVLFKTGIAPNVIPLHNIEYCYPVINQNYFYSKESKNGYVQLKRGQSYLFSSDIKNEIVFENKQAQTHKLGFNYNAAKKRLEYLLPDIERGNTYNFDVVTYAKSDNSSENITKQDVLIGDKDNEIKIREAKAGNVIRADKGKSILNYTFNTSKYNKFIDKYQSIKKKKAFIDKLASDVINLQYV